MSMSSVELEERLCDAALRGDTALLIELLAQDSILVERHYLKCEDKNVLHVAAMLGKNNNFQAVLQANSSFCHDMCLARDRNGKSPIHLAAVHGRLNILELIKDHDWLLQAALEKTDNGGTILHLCVKHNQLDALRLLLGIFTVPDFREAKNEDGMTILHLAFFYNQNQRMREMIIYLIKNVSHIVNLKNANGKTAYDLFLREVGMGEVGIEEPSYWYRWEIMSEDYDAEMTFALLHANAKQGWDMYDESESSYGNFKNATMVVASLIATMAFQAMISPPGGIWQEDLLEGDNTHRVGESVMGNTHPKYYKQLIKANTIAFVSSLSLIILLVRGSTAIRPSSLNYISTAVMWLSVAAIAVVYSISLVAIVPESARSSNMSASSHIAVIVIMVWTSVIIAIFVENYKVYYRKSTKKPSTSQHV